MAKDLEFERAFGELAYAELRERAPILLDHMAGFQVIEKNDEGTKGVGVAAFQIGQQLLYAPMFFDGRLKGGELLYLKDQDLFVPMKENWVNYIVNRKPQMLGQGWEPNRDESSSIQEPDLSPFSEVPETSVKYSSLKETTPARLHGKKKDDDDKKKKKKDKHSSGDLLHVTSSPSAKMAFDAMIKSPSDVKYARLRTLKEFLKDAGWQATAMLADAMKANTKFASLMLRFYGDDLAKSAAMPGMPGGFGIQPKPGLGSPIPMPGIPGLPGASGIKPLPMPGGMGQPSIMPGPAQPVTPQMLTGHPGLQMQTPGLGGPQEAPGGLQGSPDMQMPGIGEAPQEMASVHFRSGLGGSRPSQQKKFYEKGYVPQPDASKEEIDALRKLQEQHEKDIRNRQRMGPNRSIWSGAPGGYPIEPMPGVGEAPDLALGGSGGEFSPKDYFSNYRSPDEMTQQGPGLRTGTPSLEGPAQGPGAAPGTPNMPMPEVGEAPQEMAKVEPGPQHIKGPMPEHMMPTGPFTPMTKEQLDRLMKEIERIKMKHQSGPNRSIWMSGNQQGGYPIEPKIASETVKTTPIDGEDETKLKIKNSGPKTVKIYTSMEEAIETGQDLTTGDKQRLLAGEMVIKDHRPDKSKSLVYDFDIKKTVCAPDETAFYDVLTQDMKFKKLLVILFPQKIAGGRADCALLFDPKTKKTHDCTPGKILTNNKYSESDFHSWYSGLPTHRTMKMNKRYMLFDVDGKCTAPFTIEQVITNENNITSYEVRDDYLPDRLNSSPYHGSSLNYKTDAEDDYDALTSVVVTKKDGGKFVQTGKTLFVPQNTKVVALKSRKKHTSDEPCCAVDCGCPDCEDPGIDFKDSMKPGNVDNFYAGAINGGAIKLSMALDGTRVNMIEAGKDTRKHHSMTKFATMEYLVKDLSIDGSMAERMVADAVPRHYVRHLVIKSAQGGYPPTMPAMPQGFDSRMGAQTNQPYETTQQVDLPQEYGPPAYNTPMDPSTPMEAGQTGQKEVLDTSMLGSLVNAMDIPSIVDDYLGDIILGMDRIGRILFLLFWKPEAMADRYGREDLVELEDSLKNVFKSLGDVALVLKQKTISPEPAMEDITAELPDNEMM